MSGKNGEGRDPESGNTARGDDTPPDIDETLETNTSSQSDPELIRGKILGDKYEILSHLGSGAMGAVYKARHQILNKEVAIKVLQQADLADKVKKERFIREAKAQGALNHKNIAAVHDFGLTEKDQPFFVMDLLKGQSLEEYLEKEKSLACFEACQIFEQVARALQHAHSKGIVHRDIKPSNIMLIDSEDGELNALLVDFGIAVHSEKELTKLTKQGHVVGTPHYMSPEQISGKPLDARSDIYSLGCVMFETLTGNLPFWGANASATMALHLAQPPEHISSFKTKTPLPQEFADLVMRCIEKPPENRFGTAKEIAALLNDIRGKLDKEVPPVTTNVESKQTPVVAGKGRHQNPAHAPSAVASPGNEAAAPAGEKLAEKVAEQVSLKEADDSSDSAPISTDATGTSSSEKLVDESERLGARIANDSETISSETNKANSASEAGATVIQESSSASNSSTPPKEPLDLRVSGHDIIRLIAIAITLLVFEPLNGRLAMPIDPREMRDDNPVFMLAKYLVELNNHMAHHIVWQWVVPILIAVCVYKVLNKMLQDADD